LTGSIEPVHRAVFRDSGQRMRWCMKEPGRTALFSCSNPVSGSFDGRWLWRGGSTRSHPELGSENPLRGWYCRGHPVGEYGAAGLILTNARPDPRDQGGRLAFGVVASNQAPCAIRLLRQGLTRRRGGAEKRGRGGGTLAVSARTRPCSPRMRLRALPIRSWWLDARSIAKNKHAGPSQGPACLLLRAFARSALSPGRAHGSVRSRPGPRSPRPDPWGRPRCRTPPSRPR
jgi:hypothetical protein